MRPRRRTILKVLLLLAAGATLNVAVAWGCSIWSPVSSMRPVQDNVQGWLRAVPTEWPEPKLRFHTVVFGHFFSHQSARIDDVRSRDVITVVQRIDRAGYPLLALEHEYRATIRAGLAEEQEWLHDAGPVPFQTASNQTGRRLPLRPLWPGFAVNTLFYAGVLWVLFCGPFALRRMIRRRRGQCPACAYPIGQSPVCTECGASLGKRQLAMGNGAKE